MNGDYIKDTLLTANAIALSGVQAGQEMARQEQRRRIAALEAEVLRLRAILRDEFDCEPPPNVNVTA